jgi:hypothetical protein
MRTGSKKLAPLSGPPQVAFCAAWLMLAVSTSQGQHTLSLVREAASSTGGPEAAEAVAQDPSGGGGAGGSGDQDALADFRPPLLREGSRLVEARGHIRRDPSSGWWLLKVDSDSPTAAAPSFEMILLPGTLLSEMQHVVESTPKQQVTFEVTGEVFVYRGRNFIMPMHAPKLIGNPSAGAKPASAPAATSASSTKPTPAASAPAETNPSAPSGPTTRPSDQMPDPIKKGDSAEDIMRNLEQSIGPAPGRTSARPAVGESTDNSADPRSAVPATITTSPSALANSSRPDRVLQEGTAVISRRGKLTRDPSGGWMFIFDADATGLIDPPMRLLPCLLLEQLETFARHNNSGAAILISGQVYLYGGRNFLLPTVFRVPRERTNITP